MMASTYTGTTYYETNSTSSSTNNHIWGEWVTATSSTCTSGTTWTGWVVEDNRTREQKRADRAQEHIDEFVAKTKEQEAELTARELLKDLISEEEMKTYEDTGRLLVKGKEFDYVLTKGYQTSVLKVAKGKIISLSDKMKIKGRSLCVHPVNQSILPTTDRVIAMKLAIELEEKRMLGLANDHGEKELDLAVNG